MNFSSNFFTKKNKPQPNSGYRVNWKIRFHWTCLRVRLHDDPIWHHGPITAAQWGTAIILFEKDESIFSGMLMAVKMSGGPNSVLLGPTVSSNRSCCSILLQGSCSPSWAPAQPVLKGNTYREAPFWFNSKLLVWDDGAIVMKWAPHSRDDHIHYNTCEHAWSHNIRPE